MAAEANSAKIGILGSGDVGKRLAEDIGAKGYAVRMGTRDPAAEKITTFLEGKTGIEAASFADVTAWADYVLLCVKGEIAYELIESIGKDKFAGKVVVDVTNPLDFSSGKPGLAVGHTTSGGQKIQEAIPEAKVVKCFNIIGNSQMVDPPDYDGVKPDMWIAGNDEDAKASWKAILITLGWPSSCVVDSGGIEASALLEPMCILWVSFGMKYGFDKPFAFKMLRPDGVGPK